MVHRRLVGMPDDLAGLCKLRVGDCRIFYWSFIRSISSASLASSTVLKTVVNSETP